LAGVVVLLAFCLPAAPAAASEVSSAQLRSLAEEAAESEAALAELRRVDAVDGRPMDVAGALRGARGEELEERLAQLAQSLPQRAGQAAGDPRAQARDVLAEGRFHGSSVPGPFRGLIDWLEGLVPDFDGWLDWLDDVLPGGRSVVWAVLGGVLAGIVWWVARRFLNRRVRAAAEAAGAAAAPVEDPRALERQAEAAEAAGDLERALRLRFRAGLLRLDARGAIVFRPSISTFEVRRALRSDDFDSLAATFDDVVYGGRPPEGSDVAAARERWPAVVSAAREPAA
jgi:hypothetical protein